MNSESWHINVTYPLPAHFLDWAHSRRQIIYHLGCWECMARGMPIKPCKNATYWFVSGQGLIIELQVMCKNFLPNLTKSKIVFEREKFATVKSPLVITGAGHPLSQSSILCFPVCVKSSLAEKPSISEIVIPDPVCFASFDCQFIALCCLFIIGAGMIYHSKHTQIVGGRLTAGFFKSIRNLFLNRLWEGNRIRYFRDPGEKLTGDDKSQQQDNNYQTNGCSSNIRCLQTK